MIKYKTPNVIKLYFEVSPPVYHSYTHTGSTKNERHETRNEVKINRRWYNDFNVQTKRKNKVLLNVCVCLVCETI